MTSLSLAGHLSTYVALVSESVGFPCATPQIIVGNAVSADFQSNIAFQLAKLAGQKPLEVAETIAAALPGAFVEKAWVSGPGFINMTISNRAISDLLSEFTIAKPKTGQRIIIDFGGPNLAKCLHVGHLRSLVIGESLRRILLASGHEVISDIHLGDWGMPLGMLMSEIELTAPELPYFTGGPYPDAAPVSMEELSQIYPRAVAACKDDPAREELARKATLALQQGHPGYHALWSSLKALSLASQAPDITALGAHFDIMKGESDVAGMIPKLMVDLDKKGVLVESRGALVIEVNEPSDGKRPLPPLVLQKPDGAALYGTTDLATIYDRLALAPSKIVYVVDQRQADHFEQVFRASEKSGLLPKSKLVHAGFGTVNGSDGKPLKTRSGGTVKLSNLLSEAISAASLKIGPSIDDGSISEHEAQNLATQIGIGALKFADLSSRRQSGYVFDLAKMVTFEGKSGGYLQYTAVRIKSVLENAAAQGLSPGDPTVSTDLERAVGKRILCFHDALAAAETHLEPFEIANYAFDLAQAFSRFYADHTIIDENDPQTSSRRLAICEALHTALSASLSLLAIETPARM